MTFSRRVTIFKGGEIISQHLNDVTWVQVRTHRNAALTATDWRAVKDRTMPQMWKDYRQALRDLPQDHTSANDAADNFPSPPE